MRWAAAALLVLLVAGLGYYAYAASSVRIAGLRVAGAGIELWRGGLHTYLVVRVEVANPSPLTLPARLVVGVCVAGRCFNHSEWVVLAPGVSGVDVEAPVDLGAAASAIYHAVLSGSRINASISAALTVPLLPASPGAGVVEAVTLPALGGASSPHDLIVEKTAWLMDGTPTYTARPGSRVVALVELYSPSGYNGPVTLAVYGEDDYVKPLENTTLSFAIPPGGVASVRAVFTVPNSVKDCYIVVYQGPCPVYVMPPTHPPRLRVTG